jgi:hypothetical protein
VRRRTEIVLYLMLTALAFAAPHTAEVAYRWAWPWRLAASHREFLLPVLGLFDILTRFGVILIAVAVAALRPKRPWVAVTLRVAAIPFLAVGPGKSPLLEVRHVEVPAAYCRADRPHCLVVRLIPDDEFGHMRFSREIFMVAGGRSVRSGLPPAHPWAYEVRINLYRSDSGTLILDQARARVEVDLPLGTVSELRATPAACDFLGAFDADADSRWRFIPANERAELPLPVPDPRGS